jgi:hypothetical protein
MPVLAISASELLLSVSSLSGALAIATVVSSLGIAGALIVYAFTNNTDISLSVEISEAEFIQSLV